ncbi:MAG: serine/threonine protein phosphatase [Clostridiaceae bacterium]|jgi:predicted phosphohydrolase|nr:serine/threonine protein phosphatase [Clostridiaceae bacterium]
MALYAISDLHLAMSIDKPMDVFGNRWADYMGRLEKNWRSMITSGDHVIVPGDISWATYLEQAYEDFRFIHELPGRKIISKGNHDYWWTTKSKLDKFLDENGFDSISFMHNNSYCAGEDVICGTRGWVMPGEVGFGAEDEKIYKRELQRLELSLKNAAAAAPVGLPGPVAEPCSTAIAPRRVIVALHYPPYNSKGEFSGFMDIMKKYDVKLCIYGHLHGDACADAIDGNHEGIDFKLVSADHLGFAPVRLSSSGT